MQSIFDPLIENQLTTLRIKYDWKKDVFRMEALKEWDDGVCFSEYNKAFYKDDILSEKVNYHDTVSQNF